MKYKFLPHTADLKFKAEGKTLNEVFENSALALTSALHEGNVKGKIRKSFKIEGYDLEAMMFRFLEEILFLFETKGFLLSKTKVKIDKERKSLEVELIGEEKKGKTARHYIKAVTYNEMFVKKVGKDWISQVVLDV